MGRIIGDTAIVTILLGVTLKNEAVGNVPVIGTLRGTGSTLTSYVYKTPGRRRQRAAEGLRGGVRAADRSCWC